LLPLIVDCCLWTLPSLSPIIVVVVVDIAAVTVAVAAVIVSVIIAPLAIVVAIAASIAAAASATANSTAFFSRLLSVSVPTAVAGSPTPLPPLSLSSLSSSSNFWPGACPKRVGSFGYSTDFLMRRSVRNGIDSVRKL
jgi:hypothetical protein